MAAGPDTPQVIIVRTGIANTAAVVAAFGRLGLGTVVTGEPRVVEDAALVVLPGVGAFGAGARRLEEAGLTRTLGERVGAGRPTLAICLGFQLLCRASEEAPGVAGLGVIDATVTGFGDGVRVPQLGWNRVTSGAGCALLRDGCAYFANSYRVTRVGPEWKTAGAVYGRGDDAAFVAAVERGAVLGCQFHPEISGPWGLGLLRRWVERAREVATTC